MNGVNLLWILSGVTFITAFGLRLSKRIGLERWLIGISVLGLISFMFVRAWIGDAFVITALLDAPFFIPLSAGVILLFVVWGGDGQDKGILAVYGVLLIFWTFGFIYPKGVIPPAANKSGLFPFLFFLFENVAYAFFGLSGGYAAFMNKNKLSMLALARRLVALGFIFFSVAQVLGAMWSFLGWGHPFMWSSRHLGSAAVWLMYAAVIHIRFGVSSKQFERWAIVSAALVSFYLHYAHLLFEMGMPRLGGR